jgi:hypothetical protein
MNTIAKKHITSLNKDEVTNPYVQAKESLDAFKMPGKRNFTEVDLWRIRKNTKSVKVRAYLSV